MDGVRDFFSELVGFEPSQVEEKMYLQQKLVIYFTFKSVAVALEIQTQ